MLLKGTISVRATIAALLTETDEKSTLPDLWAFGFVHQVSEFESTPVSPTQARTSLS